MDGAPDRALSNTVTPGYLRTMGIPLVAGADFVDLRDASAPAQAIVNQEFVRRFLDGAEPIGRRLETRGSSYVIAGVARTSLNESFGELPTPIIYLSYRDRPSARGEIHVRTRAGIETLLAPQLERIVRDLDPVLPLYDIRTLNEHVEKNLFLRRIPARMFVVLGPLLLLLAAIGIYAVVEYAVSRRYDRNWRAAGARRDGLAGGVADHRRNAARGRVRRSGGLGDRAAGEDASRARTDLTLGLCRCAVRADARRRIGMLDSRATRDSRRRDGRAPAGVIVNRLYIT